MGLISNHDYHEPEAPPQPELPPESRDEDELLNEVKDFYCKKS